MVRCVRLIAELELGSTYIGMGGRGDVDDHEEEEEGTGLGRKKRRAKKSVRIPYPSLTSIRRL